MRVVVEGGKPTIEGLPEGNTILFFAKIDIDFGPPLGYIEYCAIFGPKDKCLPSESEGVKELFNAKVGLGKADQEMEIHEVKHGHKYHQGGGFVEWEGWNQIYFRLKEAPNPSTIEGLRIHRENVFIVL